MKSGGYRESTESWADLLRDCKRRGMRAPVLAVGDGALGSTRRTAGAERMPDNRLPLLVTLRAKPFAEAVHVAIESPVINKPAAPARRGGLLSRKTRTKYAGILSLMSHSVSTGSVEAPLFGRVEALGRLRGAVEAVAGGVAGCVVVRGEAGIGKSRLLAEVAATAAALGVAMAAGRATELDRVSPLVTLAGALSTILDENAQAELAARAAVPYRQVSLLGEWIAEFARSRPLVIALDDVQWADEASALAVRMLVPALSGAPVLWLLLGRPVLDASPMGAAVEGLIGQGAAALELAALSEAAVGEVVEHRLGGRPDASVRELTAGVGGNPFLLLELLATLGEQGRITVHDGMVSVAPGGLPETFQARLVHRLRHLPAAARRLLEAGAVLARPFGLHEAAGVVGLAVPELAQAAEQALGEGIVVDADGRLAFRHDLIREAVYESMSGAVRHALHREAGAMLMAEGASAAESALHLAWGARRGDLRALGALGSAVKEVIDTAPGTAADLLVRMVELMEPGDPDHPGVVADAVRALAWTGRLGEAIELGEAALLSRVGPDGEAAIRLGLAEALKHHGQDPAALRQVRAALDIAGLPDPTRAHLRSIQAHALLYGGLPSDVDPARRQAEEAGAEAAELGARTGEHAAAVFGLAACSVAACSRGRVQEAVELAQRAVDTAERAGGRARWCAPRIWLATALTAADRFAEAETTLEVGRQEAERIGVLWAVPLLRTYQAQQHMLAGRLPDAAADAEAALRTGAELNAKASAPILLSILARIAVLRDDLPAARTHLATAQKLTDSGVHTAGDELALAAALVQDAAGHPEAAVREAADLYSALPERLLLLTYDSWAGPQLARIALRAGDRGKAERVAKATRLLADRNPSVPTLPAAAAHAAALVTGRLGDLRAAVEHYRAGPRPLGLASALQDLAAAEEDRDLAVRLWTEAFDLYSSAGAVRGAARSQRGLRELGVHRRISRTTAHPAEGWDGVTPSEMRVVRLVAEGLTNREVANRLFLSRHTVDSHLRHVFAKLGVSSRVDLARIAVEHLSHHVP